MKVFAQRLPLPINLQQQQRQQHLKINDMFKNWFKNVTYDSSLPVVSDSDVRAIFHSQLGTKLHKHVLIILSDSKYTTISSDKMIDIYRKSELKNFKYRDEVQDCDDAAILMKSALVRDVANSWSIKYPHAAGIVYGHIPTPHAINWFITPEKNILFMEPQSGEIFKPKGNNIFFLFS